MIVLQNVVDKATIGVQQQVNVHYQLLPKGLYADTAGAKSVMHPITDREHTPLALFEAYNAQRIAMNVGADKYSPDIMKEVAQDIQNAQGEQDNKHRDVKMEFTFAREAVQRAEDARITTLRKQADERQQQAQQAKMDAQMQAANAQADAAKAQAQADAAAAARRRLRQPRPVRMRMPRMLVPRRPRRSTRRRRASRMQQRFVKSCARS